MCILVSLLLCLLLLFMSGGLGLKEANMSSCIEEERQALLDVKANLIDLHGNLSDWTSKDVNCCKWAGVTCNDDTGHVTALDLDFGSTSVTGKLSPSLQVLNQLEHLNLSGIDFQSNPVPSFLSSMSKLQALDISGANLTGTIPGQLANLSNLLRLDLSRNLLRGSIPFSFGDLTALSYLDLSQNQLEGDIPKSLGNCSSLVHLDLSQNVLNGSIHDIFDHLSNLEHLDVSHNSLNGSIPNFIGCTSLSFLDLSSNRFSGNVTNSLGQVSNLGFLDLSSNSLEGVISDLHFLNLTHLSYLDLSFNSLALDLSFHEKIPFQLSTMKLQSCNLGPRFPAWIKTQKQFTRLDISNAGISDSVPDWFWNLPVGLILLNISSNQIKGIIPNITSSFLGSVALDLSNNQFEGSVPLLPSKLAALNLSGNKFSGTLSFLCEFDLFLSFLDLSSNSFSGSLPDCWANKQNLKILNLSNNNFSGAIPFSFGNLLSLEALYLRTNAFVGELPVSLSRCIRLKFLDFGGNKLSGVIPDWIGENLSELYVLALGSNGFHGRLPSQICWLNNLQVLDLSDNQLSGSIPRCFDNFTAMTRRSFGDDMTNHSYHSYLPILLPGPYNVFSSKNLNSEEDHFLDNALVKWKGTERSFERSGLQLLKSIDLSRNNLSGNLPYEITSLYDMASLNLSTNKLHGQVPNDMGRLKFLQSLDLSSNEFSGNIPTSLAALTFLGYLDLSNNNLSGRIPTGPQLQLFNDTSYTGNPQLCGPPLTPRCGFPPVIEKKDVEEDEDSFWESYFVGMGAGFAVGILGVCGALVSSRRCRCFFFASLSHIKDWIYVTVAVHFRKVKGIFRN